jgi:hypothetical protein
MRAGSGSRAGRKRPSITPRRLVAAAAVFLLFAGGCTRKEEDELPAGSSGINASFQPDAQSGCPRADQLSLQPSSTSGSVVNLNVVVTDCDASMVLNGVNFEIAFDDSVVDFLGCTAGNVFPSNKRVPGTPACSVAAAGDLIGTIALQLPNSFQVSGGQTVLMRLTFNMKQNGVASPIAFQTTDSLAGTSLFFADPVTQFATPYPLGAAMYAGGTLISH